MREISPLGLVVARSLLAVHRRTEPDGIARSNVAGSWHSSDLPRHQLLALAQIVRPDLWKTHEAVRGWFVTHPVGGGTRAHSHAPEADLVTVTGLWGNGPLDFAAMTTPVEIREGWTYSFDGDLVHRAPEQPTERASLVINWRAT